MFGNESKYDFLAAGSCENAKQTSSFIRAQQATEFSSKKERANNICGALAILFDTQNNNNL